MSSVCCALDRHYLQLSQSPITSPLFRWRNLKFRNAIYSAQGHAGSKWMSRNSHRGVPPKPEFFQQSLHHAVPTDHPSAGTVGRRAENDQDFSCGLSPGFFTSAIQRRDFWKESEDTTQGEPLRKPLGEWLSTLATHQYHLGS